MISANSTCHRVAAGPPTFVTHCEHMLPTEWDAAAVAGAAATAESIFMCIA